MEKLNEFLAKYKWKNFFITIAAVGGAGFLVEAAKWQFFLDHPGYLMMATALIGLATKFYRHNLDNLDAPEKEMLQELPDSAKDKLGI